MKGRLLIVFYSKYGYTKRYVDILGTALGCDAVAVDYFKPAMLADYDRVLYIGSLRGSSINGMKKFSPAVEHIYKKLTVCGVGALPFDPSYPDRIKEASISVLYEKFVPVFYVQGGFCYDELGRIEKMQMATRVAQMSKQGELDGTEKFFADAVKTPVDEVKQANIQPLIDYLEGKDVDKDLYSPPEITDESEEKQFFDEIEQAAKAPENKQKALKKKLLK